MYDPSKQYIDRIEITYYITEKDILIGRRFGQKTSPMAKRIRNIYIIIFFLLPLIFFLLKGQFTVFRVFQTIGEIIATILFYMFLLKVVAPLVDKYSIASLKKKNNGVLGENKIIITEEEIIESTSMNETHRKWASIERIDEDREYIFITTTAWGLYSIPKRDFTSSDIATQFYNQARIYHEKSRPISI